MRSLEYPVPPESPQGGWYHQPIPNLLLALWLSQHGSAGFHLSSLCLIPPFLGKCPGDWQGTPGEEVLFFTKAAFLPLPGASTPPLDDGFHFPAPPTQPQSSDSHPAICSGAIFLILLFFPFQAPWVSDASKVPLPRPLLSTVP